MKNKVLIIDNTVEPPYGMGLEFLPYLEDCQTHVRRSLERDLPESIGDFSHLVLSGSKTSCLDQSSWVFDLISFIQETAKKKIPILGIRFGHQIIARALSDCDHEHCDGLHAVRQTRTPEIGWVKMRQIGIDPILKGISPEFYCFQSHYDEVMSVPRGFKIGSRSERCEIQSMYSVEKKVFSVQFHPERLPPAGEVSIAAHKKRIADLQNAGKDLKGAIINQGLGEKLLQMSDAKQNHVARTIFRNFLNFRPGA